MERDSARHRTPERSTSATDTPFIVSPLPSRDRVFREHLLHPLERLLDRRFRLHALLRHVDHGHAPDLLVTDLGHGGVEDVVVRAGRTEETLLGVALEM